MAPVTTTLETTTTTVAVSEAWLAGAYDVVYTFEQIEGADEAWLAQVGDEDRPGATRLHRWEITSDCRRGPCSGLLVNYNTVTERFFADTISFENGVFRFGAAEPPFLCKPDDEGSGQYEFRTDFEVAASGAEVIGEELTVTAFTGNRIEHSVPDQTARAAGCPEVREVWRIDGTRTGDAPEARDWALTDLADRLGLTLTGDDSYSSYERKYGSGTATRVPAGWEAVIGPTELDHPDLVGIDAKAVAAAADYDAWNESLSSSGYWMGIWGGGGPEAEDLLAWYQLGCEVHHRLHLPEVGLLGWVGLMDVYSGCQFGNLVINLSAEQTIGEVRVLVLDFNATQKADLEALRVAIGSLQPGV